MKGQDPLVTLLNKLPSLKSTGIKLCEQKSKIVKWNDLWIKPLNSLGLRVTHPDPILQQILNHYLDYSFPSALELQGNTRGRAANALKGQTGTRGSQTSLNELILGSARKPSLETLLTKLKTYFGLIQSKLYASASIELNESLLSSWGHYKSKSILVSLLKQRRKLKNSPHPINLNPYTIGIIVNEILLKLNHQEALPTQYEFLRRDLSIPWETKLNNILSAKVKTMEVPLNYQYEQDFFYKYSELNLSQEEKETLRRKYEEEKNKESLENT